jgi:hypothetical protein
MSLAELKAKCVDAFPDSTTRQPIYDGLRSVMGTLQINGIGGKLWADGSFVTEKPDPEDSDVVFAVSGTEYDLMHDAKRSVVDGVRDSRYKPTHLCHSFVLFEYPPGHALHKFSVDMTAYWMRQFGTGHAGQPKGMALLTL